MKSTFFQILLLLFLISAGCSDEPDNGCNADGITYDSTVKAIFEESCNNLSCHPGMIDGWQVLTDFSSYDNILPGLENGAIENRINTEDTGQRMPPESWPERAISQEDLDILNAWICNGFPEN